MVTAVLIGTGCSAGGGTPSTATSGEHSATTVAVAEKEWSVSPSPTTGKAGEVRFTAKNSGATVHELIVAKVDTDPAKLPTYGSADKPAEGHSIGDVDEDKVPALGELDDIAPGATKDVTFALSPGKYVLYCNLPAHYSQGMRMTFTVQ